jgi:hypothetical protein
MLASTPAYRGVGDDPITDDSHLVAPTSSQGDAACLETGYG